jgi:hypothetical protein
MNKLALIAELSAVANKHGLDTESNMPDFIIGRFMSDSFDALMAANKANDEYFKLSAQEEEMGQ